MKHHSYILITLLSWLSVSTPLLADNTDSHNRLISLDVKEGQAILLQHQHRGLLIDTGHAGQALNLLTKLKHYGISELHAVIFSHLHPDHASAYFRIKEAFPLSRFYSNCQPIDVGNAPDISRWVADDLQNNPAHQCLSATDSLSFGTSELDILWPDKIEGGNLNYNSLVIHIKMGQRNILLMGDANKAVEKKLLDAGRLPNRIDTLIVGHHGWHDASSEALIKQLKPSRAIISINANNGRGYPHASVLQRLQHYGAIISRTDQHGDILLE
jgi:competence protein ComEC